MLLFKEFGQVGYLLLQVRLSYKGCCLAHTEAKALDMGASIDKCFGDNPVTAIPRLEIA
jgi:hypothetical protein